MLLKNTLQAAFALIFTLVSVQLFGQVVNFMQYGVEHGLPQSQVNTITQDNEGNLWVGTVSGLASWNGIEFTAYSINDSVAEEWVTASFKASNGDVYFGHWGGSITRYDAVTKLFESIHIERFNSYQEVTDFVEDTLNKKIIFSTKGSGLFVYDTETQKVQRYEFASSIDGSRLITSLHLDGSERMWIGTENVGIFVLDLKTFFKDTSSTAKHFNTSNGLSNDQISDIIEYKNEMWIGTKKGANYINMNSIGSFLNGDAGVTVNVLDESTELNAIDITSLEVDPHGNIWIGTSSHGAIKGLKVDGKYRFRHYSVAQGLSFYDVKAIFVDREKTVWIGTDVGLNQYISDYFTLYDESLGISSNFIWSITPDDKGNIWLGTNQGVSQLMNADNINNDSLSVGKYDIKGLSDAPVMAVYYDSLGTVWMATADGMLFKRTLRGKYEKINIEAHIHDVIYSICEDNEGNIWLGTRSGAARINKKTHKMSVFTEEDGLGGNNIYKIIKGTDGTMWFAVLGGKLSSYKNEKFRIYDESDGLNHQLVLSLAPDSKGNIWLGCYTGGLYKYDGKTFHNYNKTHGMKSETPYSIIADTSDHIWFGTTYGIEKFNTYDSTFEHYGKAEGFLGVQVNPNSTCLDKNGNIWFGTILGAVKYNPNVHYHNDVKPIVYLNDLEVNNELTDFPFNSEFLAQDNNLTFNFTGIALNMPSKLKYEYRLIGHKNEDWKETKVRNAPFTNLKAKKYQFQVKAVNSDNTESVISVYPFKIEVPWYESYWFYLFQIVLIGAMLFLAVFFGRKTGGSRTATILATIAIIIVFEYGVNYVEDNVEDEIGSIAFIKVGLNAILGIILFPIEEVIKGKLIGTAKRKEEDEKV